MNDHVSKPIDPDALFVTLLRWSKPRPAKVACAEERSAKLAGNVNLVEIDGVDIAGGLMRVAGNKRLYRDLLVQFATKQSEVSSQICAALQDGDRKLAERIAHTVKGVAGNIGLGKVFTAAEKLERAIREAHAGLPVLLEEFDQVLSRQVQAIQAATRDSKADRAEPKKCPRFDAQAASQAIAHLRPLLTASDGDAAEALLALECALADIGDNPRLHALSAAIDEFDFEGALLRLDEIAEEYGAN